MTTNEPVWDESKMETPSKLIKYNVHSSFQSMPLPTIQTISSNLAIPCALMFYNLNGDINVGMSIRSAAVFGCSDVYIVGKRTYDKRSVVGAHNYLRVHRHHSIPTEFFKDEKLVPILLEQGGTAIEEFDFKPYLPGRMEAGWKPVLIVGSENVGLPKELLRSLKDAPILTISQYGLIRSLNVSNASTIVLYEFARQWRKDVLSRNDCLR